MDFIALHQVCLDSRTKNCKQCLFKGKYIVKDVKTFDRWHKGHDLGGQSQWS